MSLFRKDHLVFVTLIIFMTPKNWIDFQKTSNVSSPPFTASRGRGKAASRGHGKADTEAQI